MTQIRLNKAIADSGFCSRRKADEWIERGKVTVNGNPAHMGQRVSPEDEILIQGKPLPQHETLSVMMNKPAGVICSTSDPHHSRTVLSLLPKKWQHLKPAGRLDKDSEGLLILSSDGALIQKLTHPRHEHRKHYEILVKGQPKDSELQILTSGHLELDGKKLNPMPYKKLGSLNGKKTRLELELSEGRNRQIRRVMDQLGYPVIYLRRTGIGKLDLGDLKLGEFRPLTPQDLSKALAA